MAIIPPFEIVIDPESVPDAPASVSPAPAVDPTSPGAGPSPGCCGAVVARAEKYEATELADISGVNETKDVVVGEAEEVMEVCAIVCKKNRFSVKLKIMKAFMLRVAFNMYMKIM